MLKSLMSALIIAGALAGPLHAKAKPPETLTRSSKWQVDYDDDACHLLAEFGEDKDKVIMQITRYDLGDPLHLNLYGKRVDSPDSRGKVTLDFGLADKPIEETWIGGKNGDLNAIFVSVLRMDGWESAEPGDIGPKITPEQEASVSFITVDLPRKKPFRLDVGSLGKPLAQLRECQENLVKSWGYDPQEQATLSQPARPHNPPTDWFRSSDYPVEALGRRAQGMVQFRLDVDSAGNVAGCRILNRSNPDLFADITCKSVAKRAKLSPALDAAGKPVRSFEVYHVRWVMP